MGLVILTTTPSTYASSYRVEMVLFEHLQSNPADSEAPSEKLSITRKKPLKSSPQAVVPLSSLTMSKQIEKLVKGNIIRVISALSWNQNVIPKKASSPLAIKSLWDINALKPGPDNNPLGGIVHLYKVGQVFQFSLSIDWSPPLSQPSRQINLGNRLIAQLDPELFQLKEKRRVRLNEIHFFDTPRLGALVRVRKGD
ncbi:MAG TPA: CsiV family protein [Arenicellales bacterium]|nr:CsiV family protein [Arenicellales bacterium]